MVSSFLKNRGDFVSSRRVSCKIHKPVSIESICIKWTTIQHKLHSFRSYEPIICFNWEKNPLFLNEKKNKENQTPMLHFCFLGWMLKEKTRTNKNSMKVLGVLNCLCRWKSIGSFFKETIISQRRQVEKTKNVISFNTLFRSVKEFLKY